MELRRNIGRVETVSHGKAVVKLFAKEQFKSCQAKGCNLCSAPVKEQSVAVPLSTSDSFSVGDSVVVTIPVINDGLAALLAFGMPLLITFLVILTILGIPGWELESGSAVLTIVVSFLLSLFSPVLVDRFLKQKHPLEIEHFQDCE